MSENLLTSLQLLKHTTGYQIRCWNLQTQFQCTVAHNCHIKNKFPTSNTNSPHQKEIPHVKIKFTTSNTNSPQQKQNRRCKIKLTTSKTNLSHQKRTCHSKNKWHVVFPGTPEHRTPNTGTPEHHGTPQKPGTPPRKPGTPPRKPGTLQNVFVKYSEYLHASK